MSAPATIPELLELIRKSGAVCPERLDSFLASFSESGNQPERPGPMAAALVVGGVLTRYQARQILQGRCQGLVVDKYVILSQLGSGGMGVVYLAEHKLLRRRVAIKVLPLVLAQDPWFREQFYHEARAVAALHHPNIVRAHDVGYEGSLHFLVMEYVEGSNLQAVVQNQGPLDVHRAAHYISLAAAGLQHAFAAGLVHRDIKPGNLLLTRSGNVKVLDLGLACFLRDRPEVAPGAKGEGTWMVGTDDYLAPEQVVNSDDVDIRADVYGLGATLYFLLTGVPPFADAALSSQKLVAHLTRRPRPIAQLRPEVPGELEAVVARMMAKNPWDRYQTPAAVIAALSPWTRQPVPAPSPEEIPASGAAPITSRSGGSVSTVARSSSARRTWVVSTSQAPASPPSLPKAVLPVLTGSDPTPTDESVGE